MKRHWNLSEELYNLLNDWPSLLITFLLGCLIGWVISFAWSSPYQARSEIYVALNPYRAYADSQFVALARPKYSNLDDYKNWQMAELQSVIFLEDFIQKTLTRLQTEDEYWKSVDKTQLQSMLSTEWRTAGKWSLVTEGENPKYVDRANRVWSEVVLEQVEASVLASQNTIAIDEELQETSRELVQAQLRKQDLLATKDDLEAWVQASDNLPADQPLKPIDRWHVLSIVTSISEFNPAWILLLEGQPAPNALLEEYITWLEQIMVYIDHELSTLEDQINNLQLEQARLSEQYTLVSKDSHGLSPNLEIREIKHIPAVQVQSPSLFVVIGGIFGILLWIFIRLAKITRRESS